ncbi:MAG TPA: ADP-ribosylglycohydrolase family protein [Gemmatimonadales bacterium]|nr:ADP-ribosylglycohydrolase family protein [Gemmatimonadales bacterium]
MKDTPAALVGCLLGQALGDALGFVVEARPHDVARRYVSEYLRAGRAGELAHPHFPFGQYSDDTQLARELLLSFADAGGWSPDAFARRVAALFAEGRDVGAGPGTRAAAARLLGGTHWSLSGTPPPYAGNGSAMRAGPLGVLFAGDSRALATAALEQSLVTHLDPRCAAGALAVAGAVAAAADAGPIGPDEFLGGVAAMAAHSDESVASAILGLRRWVRLPSEAAARRLHEEGLDPAYADEWQGVSAFVTPSIVWSLYAFLHDPDDYWGAVCTAIEAGGDTDTMAAITGAIAGARLGAQALPWDLVAQLTDRGRWGAAELADLAHRAALLVRG